MNGESSSTSSESSERMRDRTRRLRQWTTSMALATATAAMFASIGGFFFTNQSPRLEGIQVQFYRDIENLKNETVKVQADLSAIRQSPEAVKKLPSEAKVATQIASLGTEVQKAEQRIATLEAGLLDSPENALSVPLLRRDMENMKSNHLKDSELYAKQIDRIYDQNKWFLGLMFTMAIGIIGLAVSNFVQMRRPQETEVSNN